MRPARFLSCGPKPESFPDASIHLDVSFARSHYTTVY